MKISRRSALKTCSAASASAVIATAAAAGTATSSATAASRCHDQLTATLQAAIADCQSLQDSSRQTAKVNARWNLLATQAGNCQRIATVIFSQLNAGRPASAANIQACADSCGQLILTTHVLSSDDATAAITSLTECKTACLKWLSLNLS